MRVRDALRAERIGRFTSRSTTTRSPGLGAAAPASTTIIAFASRNPRRSAEPCHSSGRTRRRPSAPAESTAGRCCVRGMGLIARRRSSERARRRRARRRRARASGAGTAARTARTSRTTRPGFPAARRRAQRRRPSARAWPNRSGFPGLMLTFSTRTREAAAPELRADEVEVAHRDAARQDEDVVVAADVEEPLEALARVARDARAEDRDRGRDLADLRLEQDRRCSRGSGRGRAAGRPRRRARRRSGRRRRAAARTSAPDRRRSRRAGASAGASSGVPAGHARRRRARASSPLRQTFCHGRAARRSSTCAALRRRVAESSTITTASAPYGQRRAGHDLPGLARRRPRAGASLSRGDRRRARGASTGRRADVGGAHRPAVHRGLLERRDVVVRARVAREHAAERERERDVLGPPRGCGLSDDDAARLGLRQITRRAPTHRRPGIDHVHERRDAEDRAPDSGRPVAGRAPGAPCARCRSRHRRSRPA